VVRVTTAGPEPDPNGYRVQVDAGAGRDLGIEDSTRFEGVPPGNHVVELTGLAANCSASEPGPRTATVSPGAAVGVTFHVTCAATAALRVATRSDGAPTDPDGYQLVVAGRGSRPIGGNQSITMTGFPVGSVTVALSGVAAGCAVAGGASRPVAMVAGDTAEVVFEVHCSPPAPGFGTVVVTVSTTVVNAPAPTNYTVTLDQGPGTPIGPSGTMTLEHVTAGAHSVRLSQIPSYCAVGGFFPAPNPVSVTVAAGSVSQVRFGVLCIG
jgi:hypothetical protein